MKSPRALFSSMTDDLKETLRRAATAPHALSRAEARFFLTSPEAAVEEALFDCARKVKAKVGKADILPRGLIEVSNVCQKNCHYCGIRKGREGLKRYRLSKASVLDSVGAVARRGWTALAFQAGEVESETNTVFYEDLLRTLDPAFEVTLSLGEQTENVYRRWKDAAGARVLRYLLRIETSNRTLYARLHPADHSFDRRLDCVRTLKRLGYVTGSGVMIGLPFQTIDDLVEDLFFFADESLDMVGMGPYVPDPSSPLADLAIPDDASRLRLALRMIALSRLMLHDVNIVAATALEALGGAGARARGICAGANVIMDDFTPANEKAAYALYPGKNAAR